VAALTRLIAYLQREKFTVVHTHSSKDGFVDRVAAMLARTPIVIHTTHGYTFRDYATNPLTRVLYLNAQRVATRWCDAIIAVSETVRRNAIAHGIADESRIVAVT